MPPPDVWGSGELCAYFGVSRAALKKWRTDPQFPAPRDLSCGAVWDPRDVKEWHHLRRDPELREIMRLYRAGASLRRIATTLEISKATVERRLKELHAAGLIGRRRPAIPRQESPPPSMPEGNPGQRRARALRKRGAPDPGQIPHRAP